MASMAITEANDLPNRCVNVAFPSLDGTALHGRFWSGPDPRGALVIAHGLGEHSGSYVSTVEQIRSVLNVDILGFDFRGSGQSAGRRGVVRHYDDLTIDLRAAVQWIARERAGIPRFLLGHSNGGLVSLKTVLDHDLGLAGLIISNPSLKLSAHVPPWKRLVGEVLLRVAPWITLSTGLSNEQLTHDPKVVAMIEADALRHNQISPPLFFGMTSSGPQVIARAAEIRLPTLMILGGSDPIIDSLTNRQFFEHLGSKEKSLKVYPEMRHEPLNEVGREQVLADLTGWLDSRL